MSDQPRPKAHGRWSHYESDPDADMRHIGQEIRRRPLSGPIVPADTPIEEATARIIDAAGKGKLALLVTDAAGNMIVGLQATGGLTELRPDGEGRWLFAGALTQPEVLEGSVVLRNRLGLDADQAPDDFEGGAGYPDQATRERQGRELRTFQENEAIVRPEQAQAEAARQLGRYQPRPAPPAIPEPKDDSEADAFEAIKSYIRARYGTAQRAIDQWRPGLNWYGQPELPRRDPGVTLASSPGAVGPT